MISRVSETNFKPAFTMKYGIFQNVSPKGTVTPLFKVDGYDDLIKHVAGSIVPDDKFSKLEPSKANIFVKLLKLITENNDLEKLGPNQAMIKTPNSITLFDVIDQGGVVKIDENGRAVLIEFE